MQSTVYIVTVRESWRKDFFDHRIRHITGLTFEFRESQLESYWARFGRSGGLVDSAFSLDQVITFQFQVSASLDAFPFIGIQIAILNQGAPPINYQLYGANHGPPWKQATGLMMVICVKQDDLILSYL